MMEEKGKWLKGTSGNPKGRPKDQRNIVTLKNDLELAVREKLTPAKVTQIVNRMVDIAINSPDEKLAIAAGKTIIDMAISKAAVTEAVGQRAPITIIIENATLAQLAQEDKNKNVIKEITYEVSGERSNG
jgi:hypothetical protein